MCTMSGRGGNIKSSDRRLCSNTQEFIPVEEVVPGRINVMVEERLRDLEKKNINNVE